MAVFLELNGYSFDGSQMEAVLMMERLASSEETEESITDWIKNSSVKLNL